MNFCTVQRANNKTKHYLKIKELLLILLIIEVEKFRFISAQKLGGDGGVIIYK